MSNPTASRLRCSFALLAVAGVAGCAGPSREAEPAPVVPALSAVDPPAGEPASVPPHIAQAAAKVEKVRGLSPLTPLQVEELDTEPFLRVLADAAREHHSPERSRGASAFLLVFGFTSEAVDVDAVVAGIRDEQVVGFYDQMKKRLYVRTSMPETGAGPMNHYVLMHEIAHALQDQHFGLPEPGHSEDGEGQLARTALFEGDAMLVMLAVIADDTGQPFGPALSRMTAAMRAMPVQEMMSLTGSSQALLEAPAPIREVIVFPYLGGVVFLEALWRTGGFGLVDRVFAAPPKSSEQVIHPEKYVAGELPIPVRAPEPPEGFRVLERGTMGEVGMRLLLEQVDPMRAPRLAEGWGGDRYTVAEGTDGRLLLLWSTVWDDAERAARFEEALAKVIAKWQAVDPDGPWSLGAEVAVARDGARVGLVRGLERAALPALAIELLALAGDALPAAPPLGDLALAPETPFEMPAGPAGRVQGRVYVSDALGLTATIPEGFETNTEMGQVALVISQPSPVAMGTFTFIRSPYGDESVTGFFNGFLRSAISSGGEGMNPQHVGDAAVALPLGNGRQRTWELVGTTMRLSVAVVSVCSGSAMLAFSRTWSDAEGESALGAWMGSFRLMGDRVELLACGGGD